MADPLQKIIFIDRDGVINVDLIGDYVKTWEEFRFEDGAVEGLKRIRQKGYKIIIISNQAGIGDKIFEESALWDIHKRMLEALGHHGVEIFATHYCLHGKEEGCSCRKPETGLLEKAVRGIPFDRSKTYFIGDKASDIEAGKRFGVKTIFVRTGHGQFDEKKFNADFKPDHRADHLKAAAELLP